MTISLCMIVKNEEDVIGRCLESTNGCFDEIIIVDTGSTDKTRDICRKFTDKIYNFEWIDDFSAARNYAFSKAGCEYLFWMDADDVIYPQDIQKIIELKKTLPKYDTYFMKYVAAENMYGESIFEFYRERLIKNCKYAIFRGFIHECIVPFGRIGYTDIIVRHKKMEIKNPKRNIEIYEKKLKNGVSFDARMIYYFGKEYYYIGDYAKSEKILIEYISMQNKNNADFRDALMTLYRIGAASSNPNIEYLYTALKETGGESELLTLMGQYYRENNNYERAELFFKFALCVDERRIIGFVDKTYYYYNPLAELLTLYYYRGDKERAALIHNYLKDKYPNNDTISYNDKFFK